MTEESAAVFVHGLFSSGKTWDALIGLLKKDAEVSSSYAMLRFEYDSPHWNWRPARRIPDFNTIADSLATFYEVECSSYQRLVLISHSQGGLIVQRFLARMLADGRGRDLGKICRVVLLACPNNGSEMLLVTRRLAFFWKHRQERELRPIRDSVIEAQARVLKNVIYADSASSDRCPIPFAVYAGESDNIVTPASARSVFPRAGALPGDHNSILRANSIEHRTFTTLKANLLVALSQSSPGVLQKTSFNDQPQAWSELAHRTIQGPLMKVTTGHHEIEIFTEKAAGLWIQANKTALAIRAEENDADR
jgi:pimeloyl-ACP methyl ester carboxylesterase